MAISVEELNEFLISGYWWLPLPERLLTRNACHEVLQRLPDEVSNKIIYKQSVILIAPGPEWGQTLPTTLIGDLERFPHVPGLPGPAIETVVPKCNFALVYLAPELEKQSFEVVVGVVAHEIAHAEIGYILGTEQIERGADGLAENWGFAKEIEALRAANPHHRY